MLGCNNDLDLVAPSKDIPIVYGVFSKLERDHYVRIEKAFIDEQIPAADLAVNSENFIYDDLVVRFRREGDPATIELQRIDGNVEGFPRETGFFDSDPNVLYKLEDVGLEGGKEIELLIERGNGLDVVTTSAIVVSDIQLTLPSFGLGDKLDIRPDLGRTTELVFKPTNGTAKIFDIFITFHYKEIDTAGQVFEKEVVWNFARNQDLDEGTNSQTAENAGINFYNLLLNSIPVEPGVARRFSRFSIDIVGGGEAIRNYIALTQANTGITASQEIPNFSNLSEGLGIFSSKFTLHVDSFDISQVGRAELIDGDLLRDLNFGN